MKNTCSNTPVSRSRAKSTQMKHTGQCDIVQSYFSQARNLRRRCEVQLTPNDDCKSIHFRIEWPRRARRVHSRTHSSVSPHCETVPMSGPVTHITPNLYVRCLENDRPLNRNEKWLVSPFTASLSLGGILVCSTRKTELNARITHNELFGFGNVARNQTTIFRSINS